MSILTGRLLRIGRQVIGWCRSVVNLLACLVALDGGAVVKGTEGIPAVAAH